MRLEYLPAFTVHLSQIKINIPVPGAYYGHLMAFTCNYINLLPDFVVTTRSLPRIVVAT